MIFKIDSGKNTWGNSGLLVLYLPLFISKDWVGANVPPEDPAHIANS